MCQVIMIIVLCPSGVIGNFLRIFFYPCPNLKKQIFLSSSRELKKKTKRKLFLRLFKKVTSKMTHYFNLYNVGQ